jgi:hypothetical protein
MMTLKKLGTRLALASALVLPAVGASPLAAQGSASINPQWLPWVGCWQTVSNGAMIGTPASSVCVIPTSSPTAVEIATIVDGTITERDRVDASGAVRPSNEEGCEGTEVVQWSEDGRRLFRSTEQRCASNIQRTVSGLLAILPSGEWLNAQGVRVNGNTSVRVLRYRPVEDLSAFPAEVTHALQGQRLAIQAARGNAAAAPTTSDIVEASRHLEHDVVGAWLIERDQGFAVDANKLVELADAGVPESVIDLMIALSYPDRFAINTNGGATELRPGDEDDYGRRGTRVRSPWGYDPYYGYGYPPYMYRLGYRYGWGWGGYYDGYYGGGYYGRPVVIVRGSDSDSNGARGRARAVNGQGYTRSGSSRSTGSSSRPSSTRSSGSDGSSGSSSSGSARSSGGSSSGSSGSSTGRTAKPRGGG